MSICISTVQLSPHHVQHGEQDVPGLPYYRPPAPEGSSVRGNLLPLPSPRVQPFILNTSSSSLCAKHTPSSMERRTSPACDYRPCPRRRAVLCAAINCRVESALSPLIKPKQNKNFQNKTKSFKSEHYKLKSEHYKLKSEHFYFSKQNKIFQNKTLSFFKTKQNSFKSKQNLNISRTFSK